MMAKCQVRRLNSLALELAFAKEATPLPKPHELPKHSGVLCSIQGCTHTHNSKYSGVLQ
ncbi:hypothetical protein GBAR_LOCUS30563, partial [Geodia barretti]